MLKRILVVGIILMLFFSGFTITLGHHEADNTIYVDDDNIDGPWDGSLEHPYRMIQDAINVSYNEDIIMVECGVYRENILLNKSIHLKGKDRYNTIIESRSKLPRNDTIRIYANNVTITGFTIQNSPRCGIFLAASYLDINNNILFNNSHGIHFYLSNNHVYISNNTIYHNYCGIYLVSCKNDTISNNNIFSNDFGMRISYSNTNMIIKNNIESNTVYGIYLFENSRDNSIYNNNFINNSKSAYFNLFSFGTIWDGNYWDEPRDKPVLIFGSIGLIFIPWINIDQHPASEPFDIGG